MIIENELITVKWSTSNKKWFESLGYKYSGINNELQVFAKDLMPTSKIIISANCDYCGSCFKSKYVSYYNSVHNPYVQKCACKKCSGIKISEVRLIKERDRVFDELSDVCKQHGYVLLTNKEEYIGKKGKIKFICPKHGEQEMIIDNLLHGHQCFECSYVHRYDTRRIPIDKIKDEIESINKNVWVNPLEYIDTVTPNLRIKCGLCDKNEFVVSYSNYIRHDVNRCRFCSQRESKGERLIRDYLDRHNIDFIPEKRFDDCKDKKKLPFDFYLQQYHALIEFDGEQHYWDVFGDGNLANVQRRDRIKTDYCKNNKIPLLRIPYWYRDNIPEFELLLNSFINSLNQVEDIV